MRVCCYGDYGCCCCSCRCPRQMEKKGKMMSTWVKTMAIEYSGQPKAGNERHSPKRERNWEMEMENRRESPWQHTLFFNLLLYSPMRVGKVYSNFSPLSLLMLQRLEMSFFLSFCSLTPTKHRGKEREKAIGTVVRKGIPLVFGVRPCVCLWGESK